MSSLRVKCDMLLPPTKNYESFVAPLTGTGSAIMQGMEERATALGYATLHLAPRARAPAQRLYQSLGYQEVSRVASSPDWECIL